MGPVLIEVVAAGIQELLKSGEVQAMLLAKAEAVAAAASAQGITVDGDPGTEALPVVASSGHPGKTRTRAFVTIDHASGEAVESKYRLLAGSLSAAQ